MKQQNLRQRLIKAVTISTLIGAAMTLLSCHQPQERKWLQKEPVKYVVSNDLTDYGEPNLSTFAMRLHDRSSKTHIVQIGDSHTAADFFSGTLRTEFQARYGDAGPGFVPPSKIAGQRTATISFDEPKNQWSFLTSRKDDYPFFPLGGFLIEPTKIQSKLTIKSNPASNSQYQLRMLYQSNQDSRIEVQSATRQFIALPAAPSWEFSAPRTISFPANIFASNSDPIKIGGWLVQKSTPGVMLSALGINGATISMLDKWEPRWITTLTQLQPDMVILAYGTNEAFNDTLDLSLYRKQLTDNVRRIRQSMPNAVILLVGPGDSIKNKQAISCHEQQPANLAAVIQIQREVAQNEHTLFWDWQRFMGGNCAINSWIDQGLARPDKVHLSAEGYEKSAKALFNALQAKLN